MKVKGKTEDQVPAQLTHFHVCENCSAKGDIRAATTSAGTFLSDRMSDREMAVVLTSLTLVLCEEQEDQDAAFEDFIRHLRTVWTESVKERTERLTEAIEEDKSRLH
jgi:hypothetical protein